MKDKESKFDEKYIRPIMDGMKKFNCYCDDKRDRPTIDMGVLGVVTICEKCWEENKK